MATSAPAPVTTNSLNPFRSTVSNFNETVFAQNNPKEYALYVVRRGQAEEALTAKYYFLGTDQILQSGGNLILPGGGRNPAAAQIESSARATAKSEAVEVANQEFAQQIAAAGAGTLVPASNPLLPTQPVPPTSSNPAPVSPAVNPQSPTPTAPSSTPPITAPTPPVYSPYPAVDQLGNSTGYNPNAAAGAPDPAAVQQQAGTQLAQSQGQIQSQQKQSTTGDWRVKLRLAPGSTYLYNDPQPGILAPLSNNGGSGGVVFPYTPAITTQYKANYNPYELTHSNYKGYFYQNSSVGEVRIQAIFTAQDTFEANYLLAVIHFFRSVTKMFYGQDAQRGAPPPLVFLDGYGEYQFNKSPCVVQSFDYVLPADVDYIRALNPSNSGVNLEARRNNQSPAANQTGSSGYRLDNAGLSFGAVNSVPPPTTLQTNAPTYVPTKMEMSIVLLPMQTRAQVSRQFSLKSYANGDLLKGGFW